MSIIEDLGLTDEQVLGDWPKIGQAPGQEDEAADHDALGLLPGDYVPAYSLPLPSMAWTVGSSATHARAGSHDRITCSPPGQ
jgi:hypothetical protein